MIQARLLELARQRQLSAAAIARAIKGSPATVGKWMRGESVPKHSNLRKLSEAFGVSVDWLTGDVSQAVRDVKRPDLRAHVERYAKLSAEKREFVDRLVDFLLER